MVGRFIVRSKKSIKRITAAAVVLVIAGVAALALTRYPDYLAGVALRFMLKPDDSVKQQLVQEVGREKAEELLKEIQNASSGVAAKPGDFLGALENVISKTRLEEKDGAENVQYEAYSSIMEKYQAEFGSLQEGYVQELNALVGSAKQEYRQAVSKNPGAARELFERYKASGEALEAECDQRFNASLSAMEAELRANNLPTEAVLYARSAYIVMKENYRDEILNKALGSLQRSK
ncbi:MAG: hypothetical protein BWY65_02070 [Firmicutes bacterium ADurb.Bin373]|nr:MAG: hypothetical protein BWY65_02070 [Firmicutes bacterium ADurb.Bin373]